MNSFNVKVCISLLLMQIGAIVGIAQVTNVQIDSDAERTAQRLQILNGDNHFFHSSIRRYDSHNVTRLLLSIENNEEFSERDLTDMQQVYTQYSDWVEQLTLSSNTTRRPSIEKVYVDSTHTFFIYESTKPSGLTTASQHRIIENDRPLLGIFYKTPAHLFQYDSEFFKIKINPLINFKLYNASDDDLLFENQRGISLHGSIDDKLYYHVTILESQARYAEYVRLFTSKYLAVPGAGFYKNFRSTIFNTRNSYDYFLGEGHIGVQATKHIGVQFGHGRHFIGNGMRSLLLSDFSTNYLYLKFDTRVWRFHYQNIFAELHTEGTRDQPGDTRIGNKYMAAHYLTFQLGKNLDIGIYESVIFSRNNQFEFQYLNPLILYRTVEGAIGSPDNVVLGLNINWNLLNRISLYGQIVVDEFKLNEITEGNGWWANKYGGQIGAKYINAFGVDHLDLQVEYNIVRPYTYTHRDSSSNYSHYNQPLAHPLGANFKEILFKARYSPSLKWSIEGFLMRSSGGDDPADENFGGNILLPNNQISRTRPFGNFVGQGIDNDVFLASVDLSYQVYQNMFIDIRYQYRQKESRDSDLDNTDSYVGGGVRINLSQRRDYF